MTENCCSPQPLSSPTLSPHLGERRGGLEPLRPLSERRQRPRAVAAAPSRTRPAKLCRCPRPSNPATPASCHRCCQGPLATDAEGRRRMGGVPATARRHCDCANWCVTRHDAGTPSKPHPRICGVPPLSFSLLPSPRPSRAGGGVWALRLRSGAGLKKITRFSCEGNVSERLPEAGRQGRTEKNRTQTKRRIRLML